MSVSHGISLCRIQRTKAVAQGGTGPEDGTSDHGECISNGKGIRTKRTEGEKLGEERDEGEKEVEEGHW